MVDYKQLAQSYNGSLKPTQAMQNATVREYDRDHVDIRSTGGRVFGVSDAFIQQLFLTTENIIFWQYRTHIQKRFARSSLTHSSLVIGVAPGDANTNQPDFARESRLHPHLGGTKGTAYFAIEFSHVGNQKEAEQIEHDLEGRIQEICTFLLDRNMQDGKGRVFNPLREYIDSIGGMGAYRFQKVA